MYHILEFELEGLWTGVQLSQTLLDDMDNSFINFDCRGFFAPPINPGRRPCKREKNKVLYDKLVGSEHSSVQIVSALKEFVTNYLKDIKTTAEKEVLFALVAAFVMFGTGISAFCLRFLAAWATLFFSACDG